MKSWLLNILGCPLCGGRISLKRDCLVCAQCKNEYPVENEIPVMLSEIRAEEIKLTAKKWERFYADRGKKKKLTLKSHCSLRSTIEHLKRYLKKASKSYLILDAGCGDGQEACFLAKKGYRVVGLDISLMGLKSAQRLFENERVNGGFVCGNMLKLPFQNNVFSFIYAGHSIEYFKDILGVVKELVRVLRPGGFFMATVPYASLSTLTYNQLKIGNIPDIFLLKQISELVHLRLLKGKYLRTGYEKSFTRRKIKKIFKEAGLIEVATGRFESFFEIALFEKEFIKKLLRKATKCWPFWPLIYVNGQKPVEKFL